MKLATTTGDFASYTSDQNKAMEYIKKAGFEYIDYNFGMDYSNKSGVYSADCKKYIDNIKRTADKLGVRFIQAHSPMGKPLSDDGEEFLRDTIRCIEASGELGIKNIVVHSGYLPYLTKEETFQKNKEFYMKLLPVAEKYSVNILTENFNKMHKENVYWIDNAPDLLELIEYVDHPLFHAVWDAGHGNMQEMPQDESLRILGKHVYGLHVQDNYGDKDIHIAPFFGSLNLDSLMHGLKEINYQGYFTFESGNIFNPASKRRPYDKDTRLLQAPLDLRIKAENLLYETGKCVLKEYDCFEE